MLIEEFGKESQRDTKFLICGRDLNQPRGGGAEKAEKALGMMSFFSAFLYPKWDHKSSHCENFGGCTQ